MVQNRPGVMPMKQVFVYYSKTITLVFCETLYLIQISLYVANNFLDFQGCSETINAQL